MDPGIISAAMNMVPQISWKAGDPRTTPGGKVLGGVRDSSYWSSGTLESSSSGGIREAIRSFLPFLLDRKEFLGEFSASGGSSELFVGWFVDSSAGETFDSELMQSLGDLGVDIALDAYAESRTADATGPTDS